MCGIIGYIGKESPIEILINGLKSLEYRGYDSAGIALKSKDEIEVIKSVGKIVNLEEKVKCRELIPSHLGIAHTRWATHGKPSEENAHPHTVGKVTLVHNGIIENAEELREKLKKEGVTFNSETDTEVVAALINKYYENNQVEAIDKALKEIKGSYALGVLFQGSDCLYAVRKDSPLIVGLGEDENFIASDIAAIIDYTNKYFLLEEDEIAKISKDKVEITKDGEKVAKQLQTTNMEKDAKDKCGYDHYMLKEIMEEPVVLEKTFKPYLEDLCTDCKRRYQQNPLRILDCKVDHDKEYMKHAPSMKDYLNEESKKYFDTVCQLLETLDIPYEVDDRLVRGLDYYSHTVFEIVSVNSSMGAQSTVLAGGRYDNLTSYFGGPEGMSGIGWALGMERILLALEAEGIVLEEKPGLDAYVMCLDSQAQTYAFEILTQLRANGFRADMDYLQRGFKGQFKAVARSKAKFAILIGSNEMDSQEVSIKNIETQVQTTISRNEIIDFLDKEFD